MPSIPDARFARPAPRISHVRSPSIDAKAAAHAQVRSGRQIAAVRPILSLFGR
jgi:hypothetical protein